jgi:hypothetical protein
MTPEEDARVNNELNRIDELPNLNDMVFAHVEIMKAASGAVNYCDIERRLRRFRANTHLLTVPLDLVDGTSRNLSLVQGLAVG